MLRFLFSSGTTSCFRNVKKDTQKSCFLVRFLPDVYKLIVIDVPSSISVREQPSIAASVKDCSLVRWKSGQQPTRSMQELHGISIDPRAILDNTHAHTDARRSGWDGIRSAGRRPPYESGLWSRLRPSSKEQLLKDGSHKVDCRMKRMSSEINNKNK